MFKAIRYIWGFYFSKDHWPKTKSDFKDAREPLLVALLAVVIWYIFVWGTIKVQPENTEIVSLMVGAVMVFSAIMPIVTINRVAAQFDGIVTTSFQWKAKKEGDDGESYFMNFLANYTPRIDLRTHLFLVITSMSAIFSSMIPPYEQFYTGAFFVFIITLFHYYCLVVAIKLDNPNLKALGVPEKWINRLKELGFKVNDV